MKKKCEAKEGCNRKIRYTVIDYKMKKSISLCNAHFEQGMKAWFEKNIVKHLMHKGLI